ncbi:hypothetical protein [Proteus mirabilis]|uniref:LptM family lipoprotein n=2 Tax=Morganellaceae TaxID=1903414 RepID=UPI0031B7C280
MKKIIRILSVITLTTLLSGCIFAWRESDTLSYKIKSALTDKSVDEEYTDNIKNKQGNLIKINLTVNLDRTSNIKSTYYDISAIYHNDNAYINRTIFYSINHIPVNNGAENDIYLPIIKNYKLRNVSIFPDIISGHGTFLTSYNHDGKLKPAANGQTIKYQSRNGRVEADILLCFEPILLYIKPDDTPFRTAGTHS